MKQERLFLFIVIVVLMFSSGASVRAAENNGAVADAMLTAYELEAAPSDQPLGAQPRWKSSLGEIQQAAATLLETNAKLSGEARQLKSELEKVQAEIDQQRVKNARLSDKIAEGRGKAQENNDQAQVFRLKEVLADRGRQIQSQKEMLAVLKARRGSIESRIAIARLRLAELEVDKKSRNVDEKLRDEADANLLRAGNDQLSEKISKAELQAKLLGEKTQELARLDSPYVAQAREFAAKNSDLRKRWNELQEKKDAQQLQFELVAANKLKAEQELNVVSVQKLLDDRNALQARLKENDEKLAALKVSKGGPDVVIAGVSLADMDKLQKQNTVMEELIANVRENVALLEYKVTTLQRYKDRNKAAIPK